MLLAPVRTCFIVGASTFAAVMQHVCLDHVLVAAFLGLVLLLSRCSIPSSSFAIPPAMPVCFYHEDLWWLIASTRNDVSP